MGSGDRQGGRGRSSPGHDDGPVIFQMRTGLVDISRDYWVETMTGRTVYKVDGKVLRARDGFTIREPGGEVVAQMRARDSQARDIVTIDRPGRPSATITRATGASMPDRYVVEAADVGEVAVRGDVVECEYTFEIGGAAVAEVSKRWVTLPGTFGVQVEPGADVALLLAATAAIDAMTD